MNCEKLLDVVKIDEEKGEEDIIFENLEHLELTSLSSLRSFYYGKQAFIFPSLFFFIVKGCPQMKIFSSALTVAPCLTEIDVGEENMRWKGDLNTTIEQISEVVTGFEIFVMLEGFMAGKLLKTIKFWKPFPQQNGFGVQLTETISTAKWFWHSGTVMTTVMMNDGVDDEIEDSSGDDDERR
ncbi:hypothetical protein MTR_0238s0050 [Medicago truncatula]|uniref:Rpp4C4 n=1 Tax=Medicago truncatula TaxID=3880 RepID=A0A072TGI8_MEDTR|nr:hypothetical protein MTR_0238s0050 [Medicago truncatula]